MLDGEPLPDDIEFPISEYALKHHKQWQEGTLVMSITTPLYL